MFKESQTIHFTSKIIKMQVKVFYSSSKHCVKAYADDVTFISNLLEVYVSTLQQIDKKPLTCTYLLSLPNVSPICLMVIVTAKRVFSCLQVPLSQ